MIATGQFTITYIDGREPKQVKVGPRALVAIERRWPGRAEDGSDRMPYFEGTIYGVYVASGGDPKVEAAFESFLAEIEDVEVTAEDDLTPQSPAASDA